MSQSESIAFERSLQYPPAKVWRTLTDPKWLSEWLLPIFELRLESGLPLLLQADPHPGWDAIVYGRVIASETHS